VRRYLTRERAVPKVIVERALDKGQLFADGKGNAVYVLRDETLKEVGYELRGTSGNISRAMTRARQVFRGADPSGCGLPTEGGVSGRGRDRFRHGRVETEG
jgi:hypothetical protein